MNDTAAATRRAILAVAIVALLASCGKQPEVVRQQAAEVEPAVVPITERDQPLVYSDIGLTLEIASRDAQDVAQEIRVTFVNNSSQRGCLPLPRPVVIGEGYEGSLPCLCVGMRKPAELEGLPPVEPVFLFTKPRGESAGPPAGVYLEPGAKVSRRYDLKSFCLIGHGIEPQLAANFSAGYQAGDQESELRAYLIAEWNNLTRSASNPLTVRLSELDVSSLEKAIGN